MKKLSYILVLAILIVSCGQSNDNGLCQPDEYYLTDDTNSVMTPVVFGEVVEGYEDPFVDTVSTYNDSIRFDSLMRVN